MERRTIIFHAVFGVNGAEGFVAEFFFGCLLNIPTDTKVPKDSNNAFHKGSVEVLDQRPDERHFFAGVVKDDFRIGGVAAEAVGCHHHGQVAGVHFGHRRHFRLRKNLLAGRRKEKVTNKKLNGRRRRRESQTCRKRMRYERTNL